MNSKSCKNGRASAIGRRARAGRTTHERWRYETRSVLVRPSGVLHVPCGWRGPA